MDSRVIKVPSLDFRLHSLLLPEPGLKTFVLSSFTGPLVSNLTSSQNTREAIQNNPWEVAHEL